MSQRSCDIKTLRELEGGDLERMSCLFEPDATEAWFIAASRQFLWAFYFEDGRVLCQKVPGTPFQGLFEVGRPERLPITPAISGP